MAEKEKELCSDNDSLRELLAREQAHTREQGHALSQLTEDLLEERNRSAKQLELVQYLMNEVSEAQTFIAAVTAIVKSGNSELECMNSAMVLSEVYTLAAKARKSQTR